MASGSDWGKRWSRSYWESRAKGKCLKLHRYTSFEQILYFTTVSLEASHSSFRDMSLCFCKNKRANRKKFFSFHSNNHILLFFVIVFIYIYEILNVARTIFYCQKLLYIFLCHISSFDVFMPYLVSMLGLLICYFNSLNCSLYEWCSTNKVPLPFSIHIGSTWTNWWAWASCE